MVDIRIAGATPIRPRPVPTTAGAGALARGIGALGETLGNIAAADARLTEAEADVRVEEKRRDIALADEKLQVAAAAELAGIQEWEKTRAEEIRRTAGPGGEGLREQLAQEVDQRLAQFDAMFGDNDRVRQAFVEPVARFRARSDASAALAAMNAAATATGNDWSVMLETLGNVVRSNENPQSAYNDALSTANTAIAGMTALTEEQRNIARREAVTNLTFALADNMIGRGQDAAVGALIDGGHLDGRLTPPQIENLRGQVAAAGRARELAAEQAASENRRRVREQYDLMKARIDAGEQPAPSEIAALRRAAEAAGMPPDDIYAIGLLGEDAASNIAVRSMTTGELTRQRAALQARADAGTATPAELRMLNRLPRMIEARADSVAARFGDTYRSGPDGQIAVATELRSIADPEERSRIADAISPGFAFLVEMSPRYQRAAVDGERIVANNRDRYPNDAVRTAAREALGGFGTSGALRQFDSDAQEYIIQLARNTYAGLGGDFDRGRPRDPQLWLRSVSYALGGEVRDGRWRGGLARWGNTPFVLPGNMDAAAFRDSLSRTDFSRARDGSGQPVSRGQILRTMHPVFAGTENGYALYMFETRPGVRLRNADGGDFRVRFAP